MYKRQGYNYEDAILISEELVKNDVFTSIHIEKYECEARDTKLGPEEITRDIPNISEDSLTDLDENGVIRIGAEVRSGAVSYTHLCAGFPPQKLQKGRLLAAWSKGGAA